MTLSAADIEKLCDDWCAASKTQDGIATGSQTEKHRLLANGIIFHELDFASLCAALTGTTKVLFRPGLNLVVDDHFTLWAWCAELLFSPPAKFFSRDQAWIEKLFVAVVHAALASGGPGGRRKEHEEYYRVTNLLPHHAKEFLHRAYLAHAYLVFPLLEAITRRACSSYVTSDGTVTTKFAVARKNGTIREYSPREHCNSIRDLLHLHHALVASPQLRGRIDRLRTHLSEVDARDPFDLVQDWRNDSLHGSSNSQASSGTLLNWCFLISLADLESTFDRHRKLVLEHCSYEMESGSRGPWSYYPPR